MRHAETELNRQNVWMGRTDHRLNQNGVEQAQRAGAAMASVQLARIYTSPLLRARQTAQLVASRQAGPPLVIVLDGLIERGFGDFEGMLKTHLLRQLLEQDPTVEALHQLKARLEEVMLAIDDAAPVLVVSHSAVFKCLTQCLGYRVKPERTTISNAERVRLFRP